MRALLALLAVLAATDAPAATATCRVDLASGEFRWTDPEGTALPVVVVEAAPRRFAELDSLLAAGAPTEGLRAALGREILGPVWNEVGSADRWRMEGAPATCNALTVPDGSGDALFERVQISFAGAPIRSRPAKPGEPGTDLLMSAPFRPGLRPAVDDPDTLRRALEGAVRRVRLIPRNDGSAAELEAALRANRPAAWWFRGDPDQLDRLAPAFGALPDLVVWTVAPPVRAGLPGVDGRWFDESGATCAIVSVRAVPESRLAPLARALADGLARGLDAGSALQEAQRAARGEGLAVATCLALLGDSSVRVPIARASWLRRLLR